MPTHDLLALAKVLVSISQQIVYTQLAQPKRSALQTGEWAYTIATCSNSEVIYNQFSAWHAVNDITQ